MFFINLLTRARPRSQQNTIGGRLTPRDSGINSCSETGETAFEGSRRDASKARIFFWVRLKIRSEVTFDHVVHTLDLRTASLTPSGPNFGKLIKQHAPTHLPPPPPPSHTKPKEDQPHSRAHHRILLYHSPAVHRVLPGPNHHVNRELDSPGQPAPDRRSVEWRGFIGIDGLVLAAGRWWADGTERQLQLAVSSLERWSVRNGFRFSTTKTKAMHFCRRRGNCQGVPLRLYGVDVPLEQSVRFLGVELDRKLTYKHHLKSLRLKCMKALNLLKCVARTSYGADRATLLLLYRSLIRSKLDYACIIYNSACASHKRILDTVHHTALRVVTGAFRTSPISSILADAHEPPLSRRRDLLSMRYACKLRQFPQSSNLPIRLF